MKVRLKRDIKYPHMGYDLSKGMTGDVLSFRYMDGRWGDGDEVIFNVSFHERVGIYSIGAYFLENA